MTKKKVYKNYAEYLKSDKWATIKADYADMNPHEDCLLCGSDEELHHHHFDYPLDWNDDSFKNLVKICKDCHTFCHYQSIETFDSIFQFIAYISQRLIQRKEELSCLEENECRLDALWCDVGGNFSITHKGLSRHKFMDITYRVNSQYDIGYFEQRRDKELSKKELF